MANFNYGGYPYGNFYQPSMPQVNTSQQPNYNNLGNIMGNQNQQSQATQCFWVNSIEGAKAFQIMPNQTVMLMDSENPILYMKQSNGMGQASLKYYKLTEVSESEIKGQSQNQQFNQQNNEFVLKSEFESLIKRFDDLEAHLKKDINDDKEVNKNE